MKTKSGLLTALLLVLALSLTLAMAAPVAADATFENFTEARSGAEAAANDVDQITVDTPAGTTEGDLLIGVVITDGTAGTWTPPAGWTLLNVGASGDAVTLGTWYLIAGDGEPPTYTWNWTILQTAYAFIIRITGHDPDDPIDAWQSATGTSLTPTCPDVTTTVADTLVLRIFGYDSCYASDAEYPADHTGITVESSRPGCVAGAAGHCSGGAAYAIQAVADATDTAIFTVTSGPAFPWRALTIAVRPAAPAVPAVGGTAEPINRMLLLAPWLALGAAIVAGSVIFVRRRQTQS